MVHVGVCLHLSSISSSVLISESSKDERTNVPPLYLVSLFLNVSLLLYQTRKKSAMYLKLIVIINFNIN